MGRHTVDRWKLLDGSTARDILLLIRHEAKTPKQITEEYGLVSRPTVSHTLLSLLRLRMVTVTVVKNHHYYRMDSETIQTMLDEIKELMDG